MADAPYIARRRRAQDQKISRAGSSLWLVRRERVAGSKARYGALKVVVLPNARTRAC